MLKIDDNTYVEYDKKTKTLVVIEKSKLREEIDFYQEQLNNLPAPLTDEELLQKKNYPLSETERSRLMLAQKINELKEKLNKIKNGKK